jgi:hypothetical protein
MSNKTVEARVSICTDNRVRHLGRYFVDVRDTTNNADRQMTTHVTDTPADYITELTTAGIKAGVIVTYVDQTGGF